MELLCFGYLALQNGETVSAMYLVVAAVCIYMIAYRFYGRFIAYKVLELDKNRATPAMIHDDGRDYVPTTDLFYLVITLQQLLVLVL